uniref:Conserved hypothetical membrane protein n=1 Tax=Paulinella longichromatophora TaxID=1708747 RepID=A0A2H4ZQ68_9EUKA|nr:conserved hypothetical membrane protein [Paulinella longichromatophora]
MNSSSFDGIYGSFTIDSMDEREVLGYRITLLTVGLSLTGLLLHWKFCGGIDAWPWIFPLSIGLGLSLRWIHIYLRFIHRTLQLLWLIGAVSTGILILRTGLQELLPFFVKEPLSTWSATPFFASLVGVGVKEFFCFRRLEAAGLTFLLPIALLGELSGFLKREECFILLLASSCLLLVLAIYKFSVKSAADVGDKSIFSYVEAQRRNI